VSLGVGTAFIEVKPDLSSFQRETSAGMQRFGESRITCRIMSSGRRIYYPASWDERRTSLEERERRLREIRSSMGQ